MSFLAKITSGKGEKTVSVNRKWCSINQTNDLFENLTCRVNQQPCRAQRANN